MLPITVGKATRLFDYFLKKDKEYEATFTFGKTTTTLDSEGEVVEESNILPKKEEIEAIINSLTGEIDQTPPNYSAKNINGKRAYELARQNIEFTLKPKRVSIYEIKLKEQLNETSFVFYIHCSSGTYIRSIARDMAEHLGTVGYMSALTRLSSGNFKLNNAVDLETLLNSEVEQYLINIETVLESFEKVVLDDKFYSDLINGVKIPFETKLDEFLLYCNNELFGIGEVLDGILKIKIYLREN